VHDFFCADDLLKLLNDFYRRPEVRRLAAESGLDGKYQLRVYILCITFVAVIVHKLCVTCVKEYRIVIYLQNNINRKSH